MQCKSHSIVGKPTQPLQNKRWEHFCDLYATSAGYFGNATTAYMEAYGMDTHNKSVWNSARTSASRLLKNVTILHRIDYLLNASGPDELQVDAQLVFLITQCADLKVKLAAIREYNFLKGRIQKKMDLDVSDVSMEELDAQIAQLERDIALSEMVLKEHEEERNARPISPFAATTGGG